MKTLRILLTVLLTLIIVVVGFAAEILAAIDLTVLNPWFYETALSEMGVYENLRVLLINQINSFIDQQDAIPEEFKEDAYDVAEDVLSKKRFSKDIGEFLGGTAEYVFHGESDAVIPLQGWIDDLTVEIEESGLVEDIMDYDIENGNLAETDREINYESYKSVITSTFTGYLALYSSSLLSNSSSLSDLIKIFAPTEELQDNIEARFWVIRYWVNRANIAAYVGLAVVLIMTGLLFVVWRKNVGVVLKIIGILMIVNSAVFILVGIGLLLSLTVAGLMDVIPALILPYLNIVQSLINPLALVALGTGIIILVVGIILSVIGGALVRKKSEDKEPAEVLENTPAPEVSEIDYTVEMVEAEPEELTEDKATDDKKEESPETKKEPDVGPAEDGANDK